MPFFTQTKKGKEDEERRKEAENSVKRKIEGEAKDGEKVQLKKKFRVAGWNRVKNDFLVREFWPLKPLFFLLFSSIVALLPFMTLHMRVLGLTDEETGYIMAIFPIFSLLTPFIFTTIADKVGNFKWLLFGLLILTSLNGLLFLLVPKGRSIVHMPEHVNFDIPCASNLPLLLDNNFEHCALNQSEVATLEFGACGYSCESRLTEDALERYELVNETVSRNRIFYRDPKEIGIFCKNDFCEVRGELQDGLTTWTATNLSIVKDRENFIVNEYELNDTRLSSGLGLKCVAVEEEGLKDAVAEAQCRRTCFAQGVRSNFCSNKDFIISFDPVHTFWLYTFIRVLFAVTLGGSMILFEGAAMSVVMHNKGDIALQRVYGIIGSMGFAAFSGWMIDRASEGLPDKDFTPSFYLYSIMVALAACLVLIVDLDFKPPATHFIRDVKLLVTNVEMIALFVATIFSGLFWGYFETFLFWFLEDLGGSSLLMGLTLSVSGASGVPFLIVFEPLWRKIGLINIYVFGFLVYIVRFVGYAYLEDPWVCLVYEAMEAVTTGLMTTAMVQYAANLATQTTMATAQGLVSKAYYALGRAFGSMVGGQLIGAVGHRTTFKILSVASGFSAVAYFAFQQLYLNRAKREQAEREEAAEGKENPTFIDENRANETALEKVADEMIEKLGVDYEYGTGVDNPGLEADDTESTASSEEAGQVNHKHVA